MPTPSNPNDPPRIIVIGTMKSGTTTLFDRLADHPGAYRSQVKEPHYFSTEHHRGRAWYDRHYRDAPPGAVVIDASPTYTHPLHADASAERIAAEVPAAKLLVVLRHPVERMRSHYLHEVRRRREHRPFEEAVVDGSSYALASDYARCLAPYLRGPTRPLALRTEDLDRPETWAAILHHVGLAPVPASTRTRNRAAEASSFSRIGALLWDHDVLRHARRLPAPVRRRLRRVVITERGTSDLEGTADGPVDPKLRARLLASAHQAGTTFEVDTSTWD